MGKVVRYEGDMKITERADAPTEKQVWKLKSELKKVGKLPPSNLASMTKYEVSKAIDSLVNGDATPEPQDTPEDPF